jgi:hypothetical protein
MASATSIQIVTQASKLSIYIEVRSYSHYPLLFQHHNAFSTASRTQNLPSICSRSLILHYQSHLQSPQYHIVNPAKDNHHHESTPPSHSSLTNRTFLGTIFHSAPFPGIVPAPPPTQHSSTPFNPAPVPVPVPVPALASSPPPAL